MRRYALYAVVLAALAPPARSSPRDAVEVELRAVDARWLRIEAVAAIDASRSMALCTNPNCWDFVFRDADWKPLGHTELTGDYGGPVEADWVVLRNGNGVILTWGVPRPPRSGRKPYRIAVRYKPPAARLCPTWVSRFGQPIKAISTKWYDYDKLRTAAGSDD